MDSKALDEAKRWARDNGRNIEAVWYGFKERNGVRTDEPAIVFAVEKKLPMDVLDYQEQIPVPKMIEGVQTDVVEAVYPL